MIGTTIDQYRITERLGSGGMGDVYRATDLELDREVAIKCVRADLAEIADVTRRFRTEARTLARLSHQNIATVFRFFSEDAQLFLVMEYVSGTHFGSMLRSSGPIPQDQASHLLGQALDGLGYAHGQKVVHRDIKPGNLMIDAQGMVKVLDFGIAHVLDSTRMTRTGGIVGTPAYMAPEQALGQPVDHRTDLYSLGIVLYELLTGTLPFEANSDFELMRAHVEISPRPLNQFSPSMPAHLQYTISRALAKDSSDRFQTAEEFAEVLRTPSGTTTVSVSRPSAPAADPAPGAVRAAVTTVAARVSRMAAATSARLRPHLKPTLIGAGGVLAAALLIAAGAMLFGRDGGPTPAAATLSPGESSGVAADAAPAPAAPDTGFGPPESAASEPSDGTPPAPPPLAAKATGGVAASAPAAPAAASVRPSARPIAVSLPPPSVRVRKISVHERQGTGRFSRAAGYNGDFLLTVPGGGTRALKIDEVLVVSRGGRQVLREVVKSEVHKPGVFESKERVRALKALTPGMYDVRLLFVADGKPLGHHDWKLDVVD